MKRQYIFFSFLVLLISSIFLSLKISTITELTMDEKYYVEAARSLVALDKNTNFEHPPMGKYLIALSFKCFPNNEVLQWRFSSLIAGIATVMALFFIAILLFENIYHALLCVSLVLLNQSLFVQSHTAMLDVFLACFLAIHFLFFTLFLKQEKKLYLVFSCVFLALALATKWSALFAFVPTFILIWVKYKNNFKSLALLLLIFIALPLIIYSMSFLPLLVLKGENYQLIDLLYLQKKMWLFHHGLNHKQHIYASRWWDWPMMLKPVWYWAKFNPQTQIFTGQVFLTNPLVQWGGMMALLYLLLNYLKAKDLKLLLLPLMWLSLFLPWSVTGRNYSFFFYYYPLTLLLPFLITQSIALIKSKKIKIAMSLSTIMLAIGSFVHFLPVLTGSNLALQEARARVWFYTWQPATIPVESRP